MKRQLVQKLASGLLLFCIGFLFCLFFIKIESQECPIDPSTEKYRQVVYQFLANFENNTLAKTPELVNEQFIFENLLGKRYNAQEYISAFSSLRNNCTVAKHTVDSIVVLTSPHAGQGKSVAVWFTERVTKKTGEKTVAVFQDLFQFDTSDKIKHVKMFVN